MEIKMIPYYEEYLGEGLYIYIRLNPTGRWKIETSPYYEGHRLLLEHQGWIFRRFIDESEISFRPEKTEAIYSC